MIVGHVNKNQAIDIANRALRGVKSGQDFNLIPATNDNVKAQNKYINFPSKQTTVWMGQLGIARDNKNYLPLVIGNEIFGGGQNSRLFDKLRNQHGYVYGVYSSFNADKYRGPFVIYFQTQNKNTQSAIAAARDTLNNFINNGATKQQVMRAKNKLINGFYLNLTTNNQLLHTITAIANRGLPLNYLDTYRNQVKDVSTAKVNQAFKQTVKPEDMTVIVVGANAKKQ